MELPNRCFRCERYVSVCQRCRVEHCSNPECPSSACWLYQSGTQSMQPAACHNCNAGLAFCQRCHEVHCSNKHCYESNYRWMQKRLKPRPCWAIGPSTLELLVSVPEKEGLKTADPSSYMPVMQGLEQRLDEIGRRKAGKRKAESLTLEEEKEEEKPEPEKKDKSSLARSGSQAAINTFQLPSIDVGVVTWNINHTGKSSDPRHKAACIKWLFSKHEWLDVLILQEVNSNMPDLGGSGLSWRKGPLMMSLSSAAPPDNESDKRYVFSPDPHIGEWAYIGQREYYVAVFRDTVEHLGTRVFYQGKVIGGYPDPLYWAKEEPQSRLKEKEKKHSYVPFSWSVVYPTARPVIVHDFRMKTIRSRWLEDDNNNNAGTLRFSIAIIHTTPEGAGMGRKGEFDQVSDFLKAADKDTLWIIGGDYYLDEDSSVETNTDTTSRPYADKFGTRIAQMGLKLVTSISASNQSPSKPSELASRKTKKTKKMETASQQTLKEVMALDERLHAHRLNREQAEKESPLLAGRLSDRVFLTEDGRITPVVNKIADFFICTPQFIFARAGLVQPTGALLPVDPNHNALNWWGRVSDHMPVGGIFATRPRSTKWCLAETPPSFDRIVLAQKQLEEIVSTAVYEISASLFNLCQGQTNYSPILVKAILFWDHLLSDPYLVRLGAKRPDLPREQMLEFCSKLTDADLVDFLAFWSNATIGIRNEGSGPMVFEPNGIHEEVHNICIHLPRLWLTVEAFDLTPEAETYEGVIIKD